MSIVKKFITLLNRNKPLRLSDTHRAGILGAGLGVLLLSSLAIAINSVYYHYPGNNYFPPATPFIALTFILMYCGALLQTGRTSKLTQGLKETGYFFLVMSSIALATNAAQYTPFPPIDKQIATFESSLGIHLQNIVAWTHSKPMLRQLLAMTYDTLPWQMCYIPLLIIATRKTALIREYYFLLLTSALIGFTFYYFFPTQAPASMISSPYFSAPQQATAMKFQQLHHFTQPTTLDGGLIAFPSFHAIWAWFCLYLTRGYPLLWVPLFPINVVLITSCVLLGWHYPMDLLGSLFVILSTHALYHCFRRDTPTTNPYQP